MYFGSLFEIPSGPALTGNHLVLAPEGWRPVASLTPNDLVYRFAENAGGVRPTAEIDVGEVHDCPTGRGEVVVSVLVVLDSCAMPHHAVDLDNHRIVCEHRIGHVLADVAEFLVLDARGVQRVE